MSADIEQVNAFKWMGVVMIAVALVGVGGQYFPMWGGMFFPARKGYTEEDYYFAEYSVAERERGLHLASSAFVSTLHLFCVLLGSDDLGFMLPHVCCFPTTMGFFSRITDFRVLCMPESTQQNVSSSFIILICLQATARASVNFLAAQLAVAQTVASDFQVVVNLD